MGPKQLTDYYTAVAKKGRATFKVVFKAAPGDDDFSHDDPVAIVTIVAKDPTTGKEIYRDRSEMSAKASERDVEIQVLNVLGVFKSTWYRLTGKAKPEPYQVTITVDPHPDWKEDYLAKEFPVEVRAGFNTPQHVWMLRKKSKYRLDKPGPPQTNQ